jgi:hypothetical protein
MQYVNLNTVLFQIFLTHEDENERSLETSIRNYPYSLRNNPEKRSYHLLHGGSLKSHAL